ncbi:hypothetical protein [Nocardia xishanensis]|uniref:hypothetical protein n=1 Tax=Nocardia xishanensis TaxID=238964 RepID=UPI000834CE4A|nr:hypothetical protein [Nocardia xishanensis]
MTIQNDAPAREITLAVAGDIVAGTFAVTDRYGRPLWYGPLGRDTDGERVVPAMTAAMHGIRLAAQARTAAGIAHARLRLLVPSRLVDARRLTEAATAGALDLDLVVEPDNPAHAWCTTYGRLEWDPSTVAELVEYVVRPAELDDVDDTLPLRDALERLVVDRSALPTEDRHAIAALVHLAVDAPPTPPRDADEFLRRLDAGWLGAAWEGHDLELSLLDALARGANPPLSWCELMFITALAPWSGAEPAVHGRGLFTRTAQPRAGMARTLPRS